MKGNGGSKSGVELVGGLYVNINISKIEKHRKKNIPLFLSFLSSSLFLLSSFLSSSVATIALVALIAQLVVVVV